jgi:transposase-like protein
MRKSKYLFAMMDDETRFWISQQVADRKGTDDVEQMFREAKRIAGKNPPAVISDGAANFAEATTNIFWNNKLRMNEQVKHIRDITFDGDRHNNKRERFNGEFRDREKVVRGVKKADSAIFQGAQIYHNYIRPHMALEG